MSKKIWAAVEEQGEKKLLVFKFDPPLSIDLTSDDSLQLKSFFSKLMEHIIHEGEIFIELEDSPKKDLFYDVSKKYIDNLDRELAILFREKPTE